MKINLLRKIADKIILKFKFIFEICAFGNNKNAVTPQQIQNLFQLLFDQELSDFKDVMAIINADRTSEFKNLITKKTKHFLPEKLLKLKESEAHLALFNLINVRWCRKKDAELRELLSNLIFTRIKNDGEVKNNEAILTISKLTINQLKIITLCYLLRYTSCDMIKSWDTLKIYLNTKIKPFLDFQNGDAEFQHIKFSTCRNLGCESQAKNNIEVKSKILKETEIGKDLLEACKKVLGKLSLTSAGVAMATSYFEQITGDRIDIGVWIN